LSEETEENHEKASEVDC